MRLLIANRGEIAVRIARTARLMGIETITVYSSADRHAVHASAGDQAILLGGDDPASVYLRADLLLVAAEQTGADAVHPGYGFLSENADFARMTADAGLLWIGPSPDAIRAMGSKHHARELATEAGVPVLPGVVVDDDFDADIAETLGFPVMVKASHGGGGMGLRVVRDRSALSRAVAEARQQAERAFGDGALIVERYLERPRHVEVQIVADRHGAAIALGDRDCSVQRRHQKLIEETPAPGLTIQTRNGLHAAAVDLAKYIKYDSVGTAEFLLDDVTGDFYFLEMNTRLQVEHTVTEAVTGLDLVELQIRAARGERVEPLVNVTPRGHAIEARITAEDAWSGYLPSSGRIVRYRTPRSARVDSGVREGSLVTSLYDPLMLKVIVHGRDRQAAVAALDDALRELDVCGVATPIDHLVAVVASTPFRDQRLSTALLDEDETKPLIPTGAVLVAAAAWSIEEGPTPMRTSGPWRRLGDWRALAPTPRRSYVVRTPTGGHHDVVLQERRTSTGGPAWSAGLDADVLDHDLELQDDGRIQVAAQDVSWSYAWRRHGTAMVVHRPGVRVTVEIVPPRLDTRRGGTSGVDTDGIVRAPFPATVTEIAVREGDHVSAGDVLVIIEAMKMLHQLVAPFDGVVADLTCEVGATVGSEQVLVAIREDTRE